MVVDTLLPILLIFGGHERARLLSHFYSVKNEKKKRSSRCTRWLRRSRFVVCVKTAEPRCYLRHYARYSFLPLAFTRPRYSVLPSARFSPLLSLSLSSRVLLLGYTRTSRSRLGTVTSSPRVQLPPTTRTFQFLRASLLGFDDDRTIHELVTILYFSLSFHIPCKIALTSLSPSTEKTTLCTRITVVN